jgi:hypothetical protein
MLNHEKKVFVISIIFNRKFYFCVLYFDFYSSIVPGWHTTIYPLWYCVAVLLSTLIFLGLIIVVIVVILRKVFKNTSN